jgi:hypothetical protein
MRSKHTFRRVAVALGLSFILMPQVVSAQNLFEVLIQEGMRQQALEQQRKAIEAQQAQQRAAEQQRVNAIRQTWTGLDSNVLVCVNRHLQSNGQNTEVLIQQGIVSSDPRLAGVLSKCDMISSQRLMKGLTCAVEGVQTTCNEAFVFTASPNVPLNAEQLATALVANRVNEIGTAQLEPPDVRGKRIAAAEQTRRQQMIDGMLTKLRPLADPSNSFSLKRAAQLQKSISSARRDPKVGTDQLQQWYAEVERLVVDDREEKLRADRARNEKAARGELDVKGTGTGANQQAARRNAYWDIFLRQLRELVSTQADGDIGKSFRQLAEKDFNKFKADFFTSDTMDNCTSPAPFRCNVTGSFKTLALKTEIQKLMTATVASENQNYRFILRYPEPQNMKTDCGEQRAETTRFLINQVSSEFSRRGYVIIAKSAEEIAEAKGEFDYYINIIDINHCDAQDFNGNFITFTLRSQLKLLDKATDPSRRVELANVPVSNTKRSIRDPQMPIDAAKRELLPIQGAELAASIIKEVDAKLLTLAQNRGRSSAVVAGAVLSSTQYSIKINGLGQRDRQQIRALRDVVKSKLGIETAVDPKGTTDKSIEITFDYAERFDPEDIVDALYGLYKDRKTFKVQYNGSRSFTGQY